MAHDNAGSRPSRQVVRERRGGPGVVVIVGGVARGLSVYLGVVSDLDLLQDWKDGDRIAADELIARYFDPVCRFFRSKLGDDVDDLIQRTFLDCVDSHERFRGEGSFRSYLFSIAHHRLYDHLRQRQRRPEHEDIGKVSIHDLGTTPSRAAARGQETEILRAALDALPLDHRIALELAYWEDMSGPEIAIAIGVAANTVRSRLSRARAALREMIKSGAGDERIRSAGLAELERITQGSDSSLVNPPTSAAGD